VGTAGLVFLVPPINNTPASLRNSLFSVLKDEGKGNPKKAQKQFTHIIYNIVLVSLEEQ